MFNKEKLVKKWIDEGYECVPKYDKVYGWWCDNKITTETWHEFCFECVMQMAQVSDILKRMKERDTL